MPRIPRGDSADGIYHIINRGNMRMQVFNDAEDYEYFLELLYKSAEKEKVAIHAYCLMPNHFHLLLSPEGEGSLSRMMQWLMTSHVRYYHRKNKTSGHVWQGRYKSFIVQKDSYYIEVMRYIEANALRAGLVEKAEDWIYGSLYARISSTAHLSESLVELGDNWKESVNAAMQADELEKIRNSVNRQAPLGKDEWQIVVASQHGLLPTLGNRGRPKK